MSQILGTHPVDPLMSTATLHAPESSVAGESSPDPDAWLTGELGRRCTQILQQERLSWTEHHRLVRLLGSGGHGYVFLSEGRGADGFVLPVALKVFSPKRYRHYQAYEEAMRRVAHVAAHVARIQQDNLLDVHHWIDRGRVRVMEMEWIDGLDLRRLLTPAMLQQLRGRVAPERFDQVNQVVVTAGPVQPRMRPGVAMAIVRDCLAALHALHGAGIVHADVKPSNVMVKRTGIAKLIDIGSAFPLDAPPPQPTCTPLYAAPEALRAQTWTPQSDLASLGYLFVEMLSGEPLFGGLTNYRELWEAKQQLPGRLHDLLPPEVACNDLLMGFCRRLVAPDPAERFASAEEAELAQGGAAGFHRQLVKGDLASEYDVEIRRWLADLTGGTAEQRS